MRAYKWARQPEMRVLYIYDNNANIAVKNACFTDFTEHFIKK